MFNKKIVFLTALLIFICCIGAASAAEDINNDTLTTDSDVAVVEQIDDSQDTALEANDAEDVLSATGTATVSTWTDLKNKAETTGTDYTITVTNGNYNVGSDKITFGNNAKIIGSGNTVITGGSSSVIPFQGNGKSITFSNLIFRNMNSDMVIQLTGSHSSKIENCVFENIATSTSGQKSVVFNNGGYLKVTNTQFKNCNTTYGVITNHKTPTTALMDVENCYFINNRASVEPGAINNCGIMNVTDSVFNYNRATWWAGAIHTHTNAKSVIKRCSFTGNTVGWNGGALYTYANLEVYDSNFTDNNCSTNAGGGAIGASNYFFASVKYNVKVKNCRFEGNKNLASGGHGGAIAAMNGGTLNVQDSTFIHNCAEIGQAISGYNTNQYSNISEGNAKLVIKNNQFINHTCNDNDTVYIAGDQYTFSGNTFINSPQTHYNNLNTYNNILNPVILSKSNSEPILGVASEDLIQRGQSGVFYVNASSTNDWDYDEIAELIEDGDADAEDYGTTPDTALTTLNDINKFLYSIQDFDSGDYSKFYIANGEYQLNSPITGFMTLIGTGDNVVIKDVNVKSSKSDLKFRSKSDNITFENIIFEGFTYLDDFDCTFINCTFKNTHVDFSSNRDNYVYVPFDNGYDGNPDWLPAPVFNVTLTNCKFTGVNGDYVINAHRYVNLVVTDCNFTDCAVDSIVVTKANCSAEKALYDVEVNNFSPDGVNMSNINVAGSTFKGVLKAQNDTIYSVEKVSGITPTADIIKDGKNIYLNATDVKVDEPSTNSTGNATSGNGTSTNTGKTTTNNDKQTKVTKKTTKITAKKATFKAKKKTKKYAITLKAGKAAVKKVKVTLKVGKKTYKATTNSKGKATFKITKLNKKGKYTAVIKFAGNKNFKATSKKVKITVKK